MCAKNALGKAVAEARKSTPRALGVDAPVEAGEMQVPLICSMRVHTWRLCFLSCSLSLVSYLLSFFANARLGSVAVQAGAYGAQANDVCKRYSSRSFRRGRSRSTKVVVSVAKSIRSGE
jgi:hypothetical protein